MIKKILVILVLSFLSLNAKNINNFEKNKLILKKFNKEDLKTLKKYFLTLYILKKYYVKEYNYSTLINKSIKGLLSNELDPHTMYLSEKKLKSFQNSTNGNYVGIGIIINKKNNKVKVLKVFENGPSYGKIKSGDILLKVNNTLITPKLTLEEIANKVKGKIGTKVNITIFRPSNKKILTFSIKRNKINIKSVKRIYIKEAPNILYLKIEQFDKNEGKLLKKYLKQYINNKKIKNKAIILDLRNNPGGLLKTAISTLRNFIGDNKLLLEIKGRTKETEKKYALKNKIVNENIPVIVLVNQNTASAAEVVAGVLLYYHRGIIIGKTTFGKGSVQIIIPYDKLINSNTKDGIKLTIAKYYLPNGKSIQGIGIKPNIIINNVKLEKVQENNILDIKENLLTNSQILKVKKEKLYNTKENQKLNNINLKNKKIISMYDDIYLYNAINTINILFFTNKIKKNKDKK